MLMNDVARQPAVKVEVPVCNTLQVFPWTEDADTALVLIAHWANMHRDLFRDFSKSWLLRQGKSQTGDLHVALHGQGLVAKTPSATADLLGTDTRVQGRLTAMHVQVILQVIGVGPLWAMKELQIAAPPNGYKVPEPYACGAVNLTDLLRSNPEAHARFDPFIREQVLPERHQIRRCAAYLARKGLLNEQLLPEHNQSTLICMLRGYKGEGQRTFLPLPVLLGICAFAQYPAEDIHRRFMAWCDQ